MLEVRELTGGWAGHVVFENVSFSLQAGEVLNLLGRNGAGKSTLLKTILRFLQPYRGEVLINGQNINQFSARGLAKLIAYVPQTHVSAFPFPVEDVILMGRTPYLRGFSAPEHRDVLKVEAVMDELGIGYLAGKVYTGISGGERQLCLIARALCQEAKILAMDEPTSNLDFGNQIKIIQVIKALSQKGIAVIMISHFPNHAFLCSGMTAIMDKQQFSFGNTETMITQESLADLYGIDLVIKTEMFKGKLIRYCLPLI